MRVVVVGLGTAGAAVAALGARRGLEIVGLDVAQIEEAGASWANGVPARAFDEAGIARPSGAELRAGPAPFHLRTGWGAVGVTVRSGLEVDMALLGDRLRRDAIAAGATLRGQVRVTGRSAGGVETSEGFVEADVVVDASGYAGARLGGQPQVAREDLCAAAQFVHHIADEVAAERFFRDRGARPGEVLCFSGVAGGYSIVNVRLDEGEVSLLTGTIPALGHPGGLQLLDRFVAEQPWIGARVGGGSRAIPLRRAWEVVGDGDLALIGDAACQVFAAHGSGIAQELLAARHLVDVLAAGGRCWDYNARWQRAHGGLLAASDLFRRFAQTLDVDAIGRLIRRRVLAAPLMVDTMEQRPVRPPVGALIRAARGLVREPRLARRLVPVLARMRLVERHYRAYPTERDGVEAWATQLERLDPRSPVSPWLRPGAPAAP